MSSVRPVNTAHRQRKAEMFTVKDIRYTYAELLRMPYEARKCALAWAESEGVDTSKFRRRAKELGVPVD